MIDCFAAVVKLVYTYVSEAYGAIREGSSPSSGTSDCIYFDFYSSALVGDGGIFVFVGKQGDNSNVAAF